MRDITNRIEYFTWDTFFKNGILQLAKTDKLYRQPQVEHILVKGIKVICFDDSPKRHKKPAILQLYESLSATIVIPLNAVVLATVLYNLRFLSKYFAILLVDYNNTNAMREKDPAWKPYMTTVDKRHHKKIPNAISVDSVRSECCLFGQECQSIWKAFVEMWKEHAGAPCDTLVKANYLVFVRIGASHMDETVESKGAILDAGGLIIPVEKFSEPRPDLVDTPKRCKTTKKAMWTKNKCEK